MPVQPETAHTLLKASVVSNVTPPSLDIGQILHGFIADKGYDPETVVEMSNRATFDDLIEGFLLRGAGTRLGQVFNYYGSRIRQTIPRNRAIRQYRGAPEDAVTADKMLTMLNRPDHFVGQGATSFVRVPGISLPFQARDIPIAIIGSGPAGIMAQHALAELGFVNVTVFEKRRPFGIWSQDNVVRGSRNNPRPVDFDGVAELKAAPGGGDEIPNFLSRILRRLDVTSQRAAVRRVIPGNLNHQIVTESGTHTFPIVINAMGTGKPNPVSDPTRMVGPEERVAAKRWQEPQLDRDRVRGKMFIFIGLGNSTAEMLRVLHQYQDAGVDVDYRVLTHYPRDAVFNPSDTVVVGATGYRVFRDISRPQLVSFQGDLPNSRADYYRALLSGRIVSDVKEWDADGRIFTAYNGRGPANRSKGAQVVPEMHYDELYLLTGYRHPPEDLAEMGCIYDKTLDCALHDYDGEIVAKPKALGGDRVHRGYFGFGAVLDAPHNPNTVVIPGMAFRLPDLLFGIIMRAGEYKRRSN